MAISLIGLNHKTAPVELRERLHVPENRIPEALQALLRLVPEALIFSTCNRVEFLVNQETLEDVREQLVRFWSEQRELSASEFEPFLYHHTGPDAVRHVYRVTSSLDSMVVGEPQILGQMRQFFAIAQQTKSIGATLNSLMERSFMVAKRVRTETTIAANAVSVSSVAVELATKIFGKLEGKTALIIGAGKMSLISIQHLQSRGVRVILVTNRTFQKAAEVAEHIKGRAVPFENLIDCLSESDIVISSTGSETFIVRKEHALRAMNLRKNRPMFFIDIAVPRDIDPQINQIDNMFLYDIDDLRAVADKNRQERQKEAQRAEEIISQETEVFWGKLKALDIAPTIREIQNRIDSIRKREMDLTLKKLGPLTPEQKEAIEQLTASVTDKIVQSSFSELRQLVNQPDGVEKINLIKKLFRL